MAKYRIGIIGHTGRGNYGHGLDTVWRSVPNCEIVAVADPNEAGRQQATERLGAKIGLADYRELLKYDLQIVSICPRWLDQHHDLVVWAAKNGLHVYMEKPMCRSLAEADAMVRACEQNNVRLAIAHQTRYSPTLHTIRNLIDDDAIGEVLELRGRGKEDQRGGGEDLWVLGSHVMNLMHFFGGEANWCMATVLQAGQPITAEHVAPGHEGIGPLAGDQVSAMYGFDEGISGYFGSRRGAAGGRFGLQIFGSKGIIEVLTGYLPSSHILQDPNWSPGRSGKPWRPISSAGIAKAEPLPDGSHHAGNVAACRDLIAAIEEDRQPECSVYEARTTVEMIAAVFESHRIGRPAKLPLANRRNPLELLAD